MKKVTLINQLAGKDNLGDMLNKTLKDDSFSELCILVAYTSWGRNCSDSTKNWSRFL